jgi:hypothetical protein
MDLVQLTGRCFRLKQELAVAYSEVPWHTGRIDRLTHDLAATEREIADLQALNPQADGALTPAEPPLFRDLPSDVHTPAAL